MKFADVSIFYILLNVGFTVFTKPWQQFLEDVYRADFWSNEMQVD